MSGIALVFHLNGRPAARDDLGPMLAELQRRGPDGEGVAIDGQVAIGHRLLASTPEAAIEPRPYQDCRTGCWISGHLRLDNRDTLLEIFGLSGVGRVIGDGELILRAWDKWGEDCPRHLLGDFAFALWDPARRLVFAARDQMGMRQLIYTHRPGQIFACSSSARATALAPNIPCRVNELRLAEALIGFEDSSLTATFYEGVLRLPPGYWLKVSEQELTLRRYWQLTPPEPLRLNSDAAYGEAFREVLAEAVRCRMRSHRPVGAMLSGGMDSGSVVALACRMTDTPLQTFSSLGPDAENCPETKAIRAALTLPNLAPTLIDHSRLDAWKDDLIKLWQKLEEPFDFHMTLPRAIYLAAQRAGTNVVLDGVAGDVALSNGGQMAQQIRAGNLRGAWRDATQLEAFWGQENYQRLPELILAARGAFMPAWLRRLRQGIREWRPLVLPFGSAVNPDFAARAGLFESLQAHRSTARPKRLPFVQERILGIGGSGLVVGRERYDRVAASLGIEPRDPFMDIRIFAFCLSLPMDQLQEGGWPKIIQRRAMEGLLPDAVRWRSGKQHLGLTFTKALLEKWPNWREAIDIAKPTLSPFVTPPAMNMSPVSVATTGALLREQRSALQCALFLNAAPILSAPPKSVAPRSAR